MWKQEENFQFNKIQAGDKQRVAQEHDTTFQVEWAALKFYIIHPVQIHVCMPWSNGNNNNNKWYKLAANQIFFGSKQLLNGRSWFDFQMLGKKGKMPWNQRLEQNNRLVEISSRKPTIDFFSTFETNTHSTIRVKNTTYIFFIVQFVCAFFSHRKNITRNIINCFGIPKEMKKNSTSDRQRNKNHTHQSHTISNLLLIFCVFSDICHDFKCTYMRMECRIHYF